ncbi:flagellar hook protein FlgE [Candidatus Haliotispira prima]|uniref:Flagellar hook protein FlgE n=1 Tax=Candidatus Haliotispira prima TaxID=3034016 RepID=A0ABY8MI06_9SPIO|nr:flagellar hook protein FlgE [Candidatus Haliotispira prima]
MMRSLFSGVSGLQNHQKRMDVIGNNIANVNTHGFKKNRVNFQDIIYQNQGSPSRPNENIGGINPKQIGIGMSVATIDTIHTQGSLEGTGVSSDLAIKGNGFFVLQQGDQNVYSRDGAFGIDTNGTLVNPASGMRVLGWTADEAERLNTSGTPESISIPLYGKLKPQSTGKVDLACNLNKNLPIIPPDATPEQVAQGTWSVTKTIYDGFGTEHSLRLDFTRSLDGAGNPIPNNWTVTAYVDPTTDAQGIVTDGGNTALGIGADIPAEGNTFTVQFDNTGGIQQLTDAAGNVVAGALDANGDPVPDFNLSLRLAYDVQGSNTDAEGALQRQVMAIDAGNVGDFNDSLTQDSAAASSKAVRQDGYKLGYLTQYEIDNRGIVTGVYDNGIRKTMAQVAMATFTNPSGLEKAGSNNFMQTVNSGEARVGEALTAGKGSIASGTLEMSNVDMAQEFVDMITTQRGFQANSRTIQTSDQLLQELLTLKR